MKRWIFGPMFGVRGSRMSWLGPGLLLGSMAIGACGASDTRPASVRNEADRARAINAASEGSNLIVAFPGGEDGGDHQPLTMSDAEAMRRNCPAVRALAPIIRRRLHVSYGTGASTMVIVDATVPEDLSVRGWEKLTGGIPFSQQDVDKSALVCLIGQTPAEALFKDQSPIGQSITIGGRSFRVIGLLTRRGPNAFGWDMDDTILVPITTLRDIEHPDRVHQILVSARSAGDIAEATRQIDAVLRKQHHLGPSAPADFRVYSRAAGNFGGD